MLSDYELISFHQEGFIPGPREKEEDFLKRIQSTRELYNNPKDFFNDINEKIPVSLKDRISKSRASWSRTLVKNLFDVNPEHVSFFYGNKKIFFFQGAITWIIKKQSASIPFIQIRKNLMKGKYLGIYCLDEILAHEFVHSARIAFNEPKNEELLAYLTSSSSFRKVLGPVFRKTFEVWVFFSFLFLSYFSFMFLPENYKIFSLMLFLFSFFFVSVGLFRLAKVRYTFMKAFRKLKIMLKEERKALFVLFRLTDKEIKFCSKNSEDKIKEYIDIEKKNSLRWRIIWLCYFQKKNKKGKSND
jgi:hypothetical protein